MDGRRWLDAGVQSRSGSVERRAHRLITTGWLYYLHTRRGLQERVPSNGSYEVLRIVSIRIRVGADFQATCLFAVAATA